MSITIRYRPTQSDLIHAARVADGQHWRIVRYCASALLAICGSYLVMHSSKWWGAVFILFGALEAFNLMPAAVIRAIIDFRSNPKFRDEFEVTFTPEALHFRTVSIDSTLKWSMYTRVIETDKAFILVYGKRMYSVIPKRAIGSESDLADLRTLFSHAIKAAN